MGKSHRQNFVASLQPRAWVEPLKFTFSCRLPDKRRQMDDQGALVTDQEQGPKPMHVVIFVVHTPGNTTHAEQWNNYVADLASHFMVLTITGDEMWAAKSCLTFECPAVCLSGADYLSSVALMNKWRCILRARTNFITRLQNVRSSTESLDHPADARLQCEHPKNPTTAVTESLFYPGYPLQSGVLQCLTRSPHHLRNCLLLTQLLTLNVWIDSSTHSFHHVAPRNFFFLQRTLHPVQNPEDSFSSKHISPQQTNCFDWNIKWSGEPPKKDRFVLVPSSRHAKASLTKIPNSWHKNSPPVNTRR